MSKAKYSIVLLLPMALYMLVSLRIGEVHPFSRSPMYSQLPNWAYVFFVVDGNGDTLYAGRHFKPAANSGNLAHIFYSYCDAHDFHYGHHEEDAQQLQEAGDAVLGFVISNLLPDAPARDSVYLVRRYLRWEKNALLETDEIIARHVF